MNNKFDLEAAKRGEPVEFLFGSNWMPVHFIGESVVGTPVAQVGLELRFIDRALLRMAPKTVKVRYREALLRGTDGHFISVCHENHGPGPGQCERLGHFIKWIHTEWQEVEVPQ